MDTEARDAHFMARTLELAARGRCTTTPNPRVGCVVVAETGELVAEAWHRRAGEPHAERLALKEAGGNAAGATVYVNLEPCCHQGRTPPCAGALVDAGVKRVVTAMEDPNPQVAGGGIQYLRGAGIDVSVGLMADTALQLNRGFVQRMRTGRPWVTLKLAASLDGRTAMASGESRWITSAEARQDVHRLRATSCAIVTGSGTVRADDPQLTVRDEQCLRQPLRVIVDSALTTDPQARILNADGKTLVATATQSGDALGAMESRGVEVVTLPGNSRGVDLVALLDHLGQRELNEVLLEAGPTLSGAMLEQGLVDELRLYLAPCLLGSEARPMVHLPAIEKLAQRLSLSLRDCRAVGSDLRLIYHVVDAAGGR